MLIGAKHLNFCPFSSLRNPEQRKAHQPLIRFGRDLPPRNVSVTAPNFRGSPVARRKTSLDQLIRISIRTDQGRELDLDDTNVVSTAPAAKEEEEEEEGVKSKKQDLVNQSKWEQMKEIVKFTGPATGLWICGPLMSLIDTAVIGQGSSIELAALGPGTVLCDHMSYIFMFLSVATSNLVATSLAKQDKKEAQHQISVLLSIGLACGLMMLLFTRVFGTWAVTAFTRGKNIDIIPAANSYVQIRGLAWPAALVGLVAQSASLGMKNSWGPLKALAVATLINGVGDIILCIFLKQGIAGAAWATTVSQVVSAYIMMDSLNKEGYNAFAFAIPSAEELSRICALAAPVFVSIISKVALYSFIIYCATSMGTHILAAHQVMAQTYRMCNVWGEPLSQTAQSFMPELLYGENRNLPKARTLLKSLTIIGATLGLVLGIIGTSVTGLFPGIYTRDQVVIREMHKVLIPFFIALSAVPSTVTLEGTLLAGRDLKFVSSVMSASFVLGTLVLMMVTRSGYGLLGCWFALVGFQWGRFILYLRRLLSPNGILYTDNFNQHSVKKMKCI